MAEYFLAPGLVKLRDEVNERYPNRDKTSDGWIGDTSHAARKSDHNPDWDDDGIVRALDIDISPDGRADADLRADVLKAAVGDPRVWYVISNGKIYSRTYNWVPRVYTGSNPHDKHVHVSLLGGSGGDKSGNFDTSDWFKKPKPRPKPQRDTAPRVENFRASGNEWDVKILDRAVELGGRRDIAPKIKLLEEAVAGLPDDIKETRVKEFKETFEKNRVLKMHLLNEAVQDGRMSRVKEQRDRLRVIIKSVLRH